MTVKFDPINPNYYLLPDGSEVIDTTMYLSGCGAQAVQYIVRSTRLDAEWKDQEARVQDLKKAIWFVTKEASRIVPDATEEMDLHLAEARFDDLPGGAGVSDISQFLPTEAGRAVSNIIAATRIDGKSITDPELFEYIIQLLEDVLVDMQVPVVI